MSKHVRAPSEEEKEIIESITGPAEPGMVEVATDLDEAGPAEPGMVEVATDLDEVDSPDDYLSSQEREDWPENLPKSKVTIEVKVDVNVTPAQAAKPTNKPPRCERCGIFVTVQHDC